MSSCDSDARQGVVTGAPSGTRTPLLRLISSRSRVNFPVFTRMFGYRVNRRLPTIPVDYCQYLANSLPHKSSIRLRAAHSGASRSAGLD